MAVSLGTALIVIDAAIVVVALPAAARDLGVSGSAAISIVGVYHLVLLSLLLPFSALGDRIGHRRLYQAGQVLFLAASLLCFLAPSLPLLLAARACQAMGAAAALSVSLALLRAIYPAAFLGRGIGINGVIVACGSTLAPSIGGFLVAGAGWRWVFIAACPLVLASLATGRSLPRPVRLREIYDWQGALFHVAAFGGFAVAFGIAAFGGSLPLSLALLGIAGTIAALFVRRELRRDQPILPVDLLARPIFSLSAAAALAAFIGAMTMTLSLPFLLEPLIGRRPGAIGAILMAWPLAMALSAPLAGALSDRVPHGALGALGMLISAGAYLLIGAAPQDASHGDLALRIGLCGLGMGFFIAPNTRQVVGTAPPDRTAAAGGLISTTRILGQAIGAAVAAMLLRAGHGHGAGPALTGAAFAGLSAMLSLGHLLGPVRRTGSPQAPRHDMLEMEGGTPC